MEIVRLSASSYWLQSWKFLVVKNVETRERLKEKGLKSVVVCALGYRPENNKKVRFETGEVVEFIK